MALKSWPGLIKMSKVASRKRGISSVSRDFYKSLNEALITESRKRRNAGDKQGLSDCIKKAMDSLIQHLTEQDNEIKSTSYLIRLPGFQRGKIPDYALQKGKKIYLIEQKSILRFNEFSQVFYEGLLARKFNGSLKIRFAGLFNYLHQDREPFEDLCVFERKRIIHHLCVLIPEKEYTEYSIDEVDKLYDSIKTWLS